MKTMVPTIKENYPTSQEQALPYHAERLGQRCYLLHPGDDSIFERRRKYITDQGSRWVLPINVDNLDDIVKVPVSHDDAYESNSKGMKDRI